MMNRRVARRLARYAARARAQARRRVSSAVLARSAALEARRRAREVALRPIRESFARRNLFGTFGERQRSAVRSRVRSGNARTIQLLDPASRPRIIRALRRTAPIVVAGLARLAQRARDTVARRRVTAVGALRARGLPSDVVRNVMSFV